MQIFSNFFVNVLASIVAAIIFSVMGILWFKYHASPLVIWRYIVLIKRLHLAGIVDVFPSREDIIKYRRAPRKSDYILGAKTDFTYIGLFFPVDEEWEKVKESFLEIMRDGCEVEIIFWSPKIETVFSQPMAEYYLVTHPSLQNEIQASWNQLKQFKSDLPDMLRKRFRLKTHKEMITDSVFLLNQGGKDSKIFLDMKLYGLGKERSLAIELKQSHIKNSLYTRVSSSFGLIRKASEDLDL